MMSYEFIWCHVILHCITFYDNHIIRHYITSCYITTRQRNTHVRALVHVYVIVRYEYNSYTYRYHTGVCEKNTPPEKRTLGKIGFRSTKSGAGEQFLPLECKAKACAKAVSFSETPVRITEGPGPRSCPCRVSARHGRARGCSAERRAPESRSDVP